LYLACSQPPPKNLKRKTQISGFPLNEISGCEQASSNIGTDRSGFLGRRKGGGGAEKGRRRGGGGVEGGPDFCGGASLKIQGGAHYICR
jgi:hypothetical protein